MKKIVFTLLIFIVPFTASAQYIVHIAGNDSCGYSGDGGLAINASFNNPVGICRDTADNLYIAVNIYGGLGGIGGGGGTGSVGKIRKIDAATGIVTTVAGGPTGITVTDTLDNIPATAAALSEVLGLCIDKAGNLLIGTPLRLRSVNMVTGIITTVAGTGGSGYWGDGGPATAAAIVEPSGVAIDAVNNIYIACSSGMVRKISAATGIISTVAGKGIYGYSGDGGPATAALLYHPFSVCLDRAGNLYIADAGNNNVRMVSGATGIIRAVAGNDTMGYSGDGGAATAARLSVPGSIAIDNAGNLYISDYSNSRIRKVDSITGIISTYAGNGSAAYPDSVGDGRSATFAELSPRGLCFDTCDNLFFSDEYCRVRAITRTLPLSLSCNPLITTAVAGQYASEGALRIWPNPSIGGQFTLNMPSAAGEAVQVVITNVVGQVVEQLGTVANKDTEVRLHVPAGVYYINARLPDGSGRVGKVVVE